MHHPNRNPSLNLVWHLQKLCGFCTLWGHPENEQRNWLNNEIVELNRKCLQNVDKISDVALDV
jgi:hypothetical protein